MLTSESSSETFTIKPEEAQRHYQDLNKSLAEDSLPEYIRQAWHVVEPATPYLHNWHIDLICEHLELITLAVVGKLDLSDPQYKDILNSIFNIPPRYMKSLCITVMWPTWAWIKHPHLRWLFSSYSSALSKKHSGDRRKIIDSEWYQQNWGKVYQLSLDQNEKMFYENTRGGHMISTSTGGSATGKGGHIIVEDDPHNPQQAESDAERKTALDFHDTTLSTRLDDKKRGARVVVMQRLHEEDVTGHDLKKGNVRHVNIRAVAEGDEPYHFPLSGRILTRSDGDLLWPEREGQKEIEKAKLDLGPYGFAGQYQQRPAPMEGGIIKRHWWRFWYTGMQPPTPVTVRMADGSLHECPQIPLPERFDQMCQSWDMAFKDTKDSAYVVGQAWGRKQARKFLLDQDRKKRTFPESVKGVREFSAKWPKIRAKLVEDKANGPAIISTLQEEIEGLIAIEPEGDKEARTMGVHPTIAAGDVYLPHPSIHPWVNDFLGEWTAFPNGAYKDQVDAGTQALEYLRSGVFKLEEVGETVASRGW